MSKFVISFYGSSGDGYVSYDNRPCISLDMAMIFGSKNDALSKLSVLQNEWHSDLRVEEVEL